MSVARVNKCWRCASDRTGVTPRREDLFHPSRRNRSALPLELTPRTWRTTKSRE